MRSRYLVKMALSPASATVLSASVGVGIGALIDRLKRKKGEEVDKPWVSPAIGGLLMATPPILYGIARHSLDKGPDGKHSIPLTKRWFMSDKDFYEKSLYAKYNSKKRDEDYNSRSSFEAQNKKMNANKNTSGVQTASNLTRNGEVKATVPKYASFDESTINPICDINVNAFNQEIWADAYRGRTPTEAAGIVSNTLNSTKKRFGSNFVSPGQVIDTMVNAGIGYGTAWLAGKTLGAMAGLSENAQEKLQQIGTWGGIMQGIGNSISN